MSTTAIVLIGIAIWVVVAVIGAILFGRFVHIGRGGDER